MIEFRLPSLGSEMDKGKLLEWKVKPGDAVERGSVVAVVDTSKSAIDVEIWDEGTVYELVLRPGETVPVGTVMATLLEPEETIEHAEAEKQRKLAEARSTEKVAALVPASAEFERRSGAVTEARRRMSPAARKRAEELGVDVTALTGSGPQGSIVLEDVEKAAATKAQPQDRASEMRRAIAAAMARSKREIPHYYLASDIPLDRASRWLASRNEARPVTDRVIMAVLLLKAVALALKKYPELNGFFRDGAFQPVPGIHLGVAISLRQGGLIAPAIRDADKKGLDELMQGLTDLVARARALTLKSSEISDPTITVTNLGEQGAGLVHGVIYPPQVALVGFGKVRERPWAESGRLVVTHVVTATLSADHRVSDGHRGALFLNEVARLLQEPEQL